MLEQELGFQLLIHNGRGVVLSPEGKLFLERVRIALKTLDDARAEITAANDVPRGRLALGISPSIGVPGGRTGGPAIPRDIPAG